MKVFQSKGKITVTNFQIQFQIELLILITKKNRESRQLHDVTKPNQEKLNAGF